MFFYFTLKSRVLLEIYNKKIYNIPILRCGFMDNIIQIKDLNFTYQDQVIFKNLNLNIKKNSFVSIIGPNGSGKSTLIRILSGLNSYDGYITINGHYLNKENIKIIRRTLGVVFDNPDNQFIGQTVIDDLAFNLENLSYSKEEINKEISYIAKLFKIEKILLLEPSNLNNSTKQKVAIASALIHKPKILMLDESLHQLDNKDKKIVFKALETYKKEHDLTIILITHNQEDTILSDRIIVIDKQKIILDGKVEEVYTKEKILHNLGIEIPFIIKLSINLKLYDLIDEIYLDKDKLVNKLWLD